jgi:hypothetical protein
MSVTRTWYRQDNFIMTSKCTSTYRDWHKTRHPDTSPSSGQPHANQLNCRAVNGHAKKMNHYNVTNRAYNRQTLKSIFY